MKFEDLKKKRIEEKISEYMKKGQSPNPMSYTLTQLLDHFFAEVGKLQHLRYHGENCRVAMADVSNLHDMIIEKMQELEEAQP
jgi:molybdopterin biosynthesis enzyme